MAYFEFENKKVYYKIQGQGEPLLLLHGNSVSSKMFAFLLSKYSKEFQSIVIDFPGHGKSDRLEKFPTDFWFYNSEVCNSLIEKLNLCNVNVIGTSGGALVAINLGLEHPEKIKNIIADSFEGEYPLPTYIKTIRTDREKDKKKLLAKLFWRYSHGKDWRKVVDLDTDVNLEFFDTGRSFFHKSISDLKPKTLLTGSMKDEYCSHLESIFKKLKDKNPRLDIHLFKEGKHPAMLSNKIEFINLVKDRLK